MRWLGCCLLLAGCLRARATVVHPTEHERSSGDSGSTIARLAPASNDPQPADSNPNLGSLELGAIVPFPLETARVHLAPGVRIFDSHPESVLFGVAVGADFFGNGRGPGFALEGSVHAGNSGNDPTLIVQAVDLFAGVTVRPARAQMSVAVGPSLGILGMPGGHSVVMLGLGLRVISGPKP